MRKNNGHQHERGMALILALLALLLISAVGLGMIYMSTTETSINTNYKDTQLAFFAMRGGLEEMRDRMRTNSVSPVAIPAAMPGAANSILYIVNPSGVADVVDPKTFGNTYFDDEFCHESFVGSTVAYVAPGTPCPGAGAPPAGSVSPYVASASPFTNTASSLKYKWARITLKQNGTFPNALVDSSQPAASQVCWNSANAQEIVSTALGYPDCNTAQNAGFMVAPLYLVTSLAITPQASRRVGQYESAALNITPPPAGLALDGPAPIFNTPHSANGSINGNNGSNSVSGTVPPVVPGCVPNPAVSVPAIGADSAADTASIPPQIFRPGNFTGSGPAPSVVDQGSDAGGTNQLTNWSTPTQLNTMASEIGDGADQTFNCGIGGVGGAGCSGSYGTAAAPQITYINGDVTLGGGAGVLVVTGTLTISGGMQWDGLILVIGQGNVVINGGGAGEIFGQMLVAKTNSSVSPFPQLAGLASPTFTWNGGGKASITYNSCWANIGNTMHYMVVASREEMY
jgi:Tfp pilus assembly protein PilV